MDETLPEELAARLVQRVAERAGIRIPEGKRWLLASRLRERATRTGAPSVRVYVDRLLASEETPELDSLIEALRVGETQFFRHKAQLRLLARVAIPDVVEKRKARGDKGIRAWSAGCASGEEPYTIAMLLEDAYPERDGYAHEILATDLSQPALDHAREGRYPAAAIREVPERIAAWAFAPGGPEPATSPQAEVVVTPRVRKSVRFARRNLLDPVYPTGFDLVLCRNVLIYFDRGMQRDVTERLAAALRPGGYLALGYSERVEVESAELVPVRTEDGVLWRRLGLGEMPQTRAKHEPRTAKAPSQPPPPPRARMSTPPPPRGRVSTPTPPRRHSSRPPPAPAPSMPKLIGETSVAEARAAIGQLLREPAPCLDLRELRYADDAIGELLARAAATLASEGRTLRVIVRAQGVSQFLRRHNVVPPAEIAEEP